MTLMALSLCIGLLIDDAIVVRENIVRHIHMGKDHYSAARQGTDEIGLAVLATTFSIVAVFVPIAFMSGIIGKFFFSFGITVTAAVLVSLFVSFTLDPMLSGRLARSARGRAPTSRTSGRCCAPSAACSISRTSCTTSCCARRSSTARPRFAIALATFAASVPVAGIVGTEMMPEADESFISLRLTLPVGSSIDYADERVRRVEEGLREFKEIDTIDTTVGTDQGKNTARINLKLVPRSDRSRTQKQLEMAIRKRLAAVPGIELRVGWGGPIYVALLGNDDAAMQRVIADFTKKVAAIRGITDIEVSLKEGTPALSVRLKPELASEAGITHAQLGTTLRALIGGETSGYWLAPDGQNYEVITQVPRANRTAIDDIANLNIATGASSPMDCRDRAAAFDRDDREVRQSGKHPAPGPAAAHRVLGERRGTAKRRRRKRGAGAREVLSPAPGPALEIGGQIQDQQEINAAMLSALALAVIFIYIVLASQFGSFLQPVAIMAFAAALDRRRDARAGGDRHHVEHLLDDRFGVPHGPGDEERDPARRFREPGPAQRHEPQRSAARRRPGTPAPDLDDHRRDDVRHAAACARPRRRRRAAGADGPRDHRRRDYLDAADARRRAGDL
jgi:multidrug efflux pump subunit AcrB